MKNKEQNKIALERINETLYALHAEAPVETLSRIFTWLMAEYGRLLDEGTAQDSVQLISEAKRMLVEAYAIAIFVMQGDPKDNSLVEKIALDVLPKNVRKENAYKIAASAPAALANCNYDELFSQLRGLCEYHEIQIAARLIDSCNLKKEYIDTHPSLF